METGSLNYSLLQIANWTKGESEVTIPALQRGLVLKPNQVELLWDSILRGFPIGSFLLSDISDDNKNAKYYKNYAIGSEQNSRRLHDLQCLPIQISSN